METLKNKHIGETFYIIGEGPSMHKLTKWHFNKGVYIALYRAVEILERFLLSPLYSMQKDNIVTIPKYATLLCHKWESFKRCKINYKPMVVFDNELLGLNRGSHSQGFSLQSALRLSEWMGAKDVVLYAFDAHTNGDLTNYNGQKDYNYLKQVQGMKDFKLNIPFNHEPVS